MPPNDEGVEVTTEGVEASEEGQVGTVDEQAGTTADQTQTDTTATVETAEGGEIVVQVGDEAPVQETQAPEWVKNLRQEYASLKRRNQELEETLKAATTPQPQALGNTPTLESCDFDTATYEKALADWIKKKSDIERQEEEAKKEKEEEERTWVTKVNDFEDEKKAMSKKIKDFDDAFVVAESSLSVTQRGIIVQGAKDPALVMYAIGKSPERAEKLARIKDPVKFTFAVAQLEKDMKVTTVTKKPPPPERVPQGHGASSAGGSDAALEKLRKEAAETGDISRVVAYKRSLRAK